MVHLASALAILFDLAEGDGEGARITFPDLGFTSRLVYNFAEVQVGLPVKLVLADFRQDVAPRAGEAHGEVARCRLLGRRRRARR